MAASRRGNSDLGASENSGYFSFGALVITIRLFRVLF